ncbi:MAG TPA: tetratricopeptide repeat protein [Pyrinomonadaceae bacterium]|nr:tetratricopeptide repeat protein [Pyrinomonadaceae bacterium]
MKIARLEVSLFRRELRMVVFFAFVFLVSTASAFGQGNSISGHVFGADRRPVADVQVELLDDLSRTLQRITVNSSGRYSFYRLPSGRFKIRVLPFGTDYEQQEQDVEIVNFTRGSGSGDDRILGASNEQRDFYLRLRPGAPIGVTGSIFVQDVPPAAKKLYDLGVEELKAKRSAEAYTALKSSLEIFPKYFAALELLGTEYLKAGHYEASQVLLTLATEVNPRSFRSWHGVAYSLFSQKKYPEAIAAIGKAMEINGAAPEGMLLNGVLLRRTMKYDEAEKQLAKAKELYGDSLPEIRRELGLVYADKKRYKDATKELRSYLKARPDAKDADAIKTLLVELEGRTG